MKKDPLIMPAFGDGQAPQDSVSYAVYVRDMASASLHSLHVDLKGVEIYTSILQEKKLYLKLQDADGKYFRSWTEFCLAKKPYGLERRAEDIHQLLHEAQDPQAIAEKAVPLAEPGEIGRGRDRVYSVNSNPPKSKGGNRSEYRTAKIARDAPEVWERMKAGEFKTVAAAERAAGIKTIEDRRIWLSTNPAEAAEKLSVNFNTEYLKELIRQLQKRLQNERADKNAA